VVLFAVGLGFEALVVLHDDGLGPVAVGCSGLQWVAVGCSATRNQQV